MTLKTMTDSNVTNETISVEAMWELNNLCISNTDETTEEQKNLLSHEEPATDDIPPSLISYFETSKTRAAVCEKLILEEAEDFTISYEDMMHVPAGEDIMVVNEQGIYETENESNTSTDTHHLPVLTETEAVFPSNEDETETDGHMGSEKQRENREKQHLEEMLAEEQIRQRENVFQEELMKLLEAEKLHQMKLQLMEKRAQEKLERELLLQQELMSNLQKQVEEKRRMVEEGLKNIKEEEEKKRKQEDEKMKREEEDRKKREDEKIEREVQRERMKEKLRRNKEEEEERKIKEINTEDERQKKEEEQRKKTEEEEKRKIREINAAEERRSKEEEQRKNREVGEKRKVKVIKAEEDRNKKEEVQRKKTEEEEKRKIREINAAEERRSKEEEQRKKTEEEEKRKLKEIKAEEEKSNKEEEQREKTEEEEKRKREELKKEEERKAEERKREIRLKEEKKMRQVEEGERKKKESEDNINEEGGDKEREEEEETTKRKEEKTMIAVTGKRIEGDKNRGNENEIKPQEEWRKEERETIVEKDVRLIKELDVRTQQEERGVDRKREEERTKARTYGQMMGEQMRQKEEENRKIEDEMQLKEDKEKRKTHVDRRHSTENKDIIKEEEKIKEEEWKKRQVKEIRRQKEDKDGCIDDEIMLKEKEGCKTYEAEIRKVEHERKTKEKERRHDQKKKKLENDGKRKGEGRGVNTEAEEGQVMEEVSENKEENIETEERRLKEDQKSKMIIVTDSANTERLKRANDLQEKKRENNSTNEINNAGGTVHSLTSQMEESGTFLGAGPVHSESSSSETVQQDDLDKNISETYITDQQDAVVKLCKSSSSLPRCLPEYTEQKRLSWMKHCISWSKLSLQNRRKQRGSVRNGRLPRRAAEASSLPPLCPDTVLLSTGCKSLQEVTTVTLEDLPGCNLSTLVQCTQLRSLTLRRCGLKSLEGISQLSELCYIDVEENHISFIDCENMTSLRVLRLGHNKLTSIHGLRGADNLEVLEISHNNITRIAGLESMRRLQRLSVDHNQLISTKGLKDVYTLLHLNCSHNHLANVEGLENSALLNTLDLRANSLTEPPSLDNHVLLRELRLDDNCISSLQGLTACWLPLMQHLSVAQNRITQLPSMSDFVSLANLDLRFNCMSELQNVCESLEGCQFLQNIHLTGNPLEQESGWRSTLRALPGLRAIDGQETDSFLSPPTVDQISLASVSFLTFCQAQLQQINDLQQQHSGELSKASSSLDIMESLCQHFTETLKLAENQRFAHEYGEMAVSAGPTVLEKSVNMESTSDKKFLGKSQMESSEKVPAIVPSRNNIRCSYWALEGKSSTESWPHTLDTVTAVPKTGLHSLATKGKTSSSNSKMEALSCHQDLDLKNTAAVTIQQQWRRYRQKCGNIRGPPAAEKRRGTGDVGNPDSGHFHINRSTVDQHDAATVIQASWRGYSVRRRLASALAAVTCPSTREDDTFEEVDVDEFVFDEAELEKRWTLQFSEDSPSRHEPVSEQPLSLKNSNITLNMDSALTQSAGPFPESFQYTLALPPVWRPKQAWVAGEEVDSAAQRVSPEESHRKSPPSTSVLSGISERSEKILDEWGFTNSHTALLMLKRAQKMKSKQQQKKKYRDPSVRLALFRHCNNQLGPVEARNRSAPHSRNDIKVCEAELDLQQAKKTEQVKQEQAQKRLHTLSDRGSESEHFLPEISSDILNGGRVQLVCMQADPASTERHHGSGLWALSSLAALHSKQNSYPHRIPLGHARKDVPSPKRVTSAPSKKERISFRDNPVQLSGGWGAGKKRDK